MNQKGFTLIEIMVVVIILAVLAALVIPRFGGRTEQARIAAARTQIDSLFSTALDMYEADNGTYPSTEQGLQALRVQPTTEPVPKNWKGPYLKKDVPLDPWGNAYVYVFPGTHNVNGYDLYSFGPDGQDGTSDDITNWATTETK
ncbi:MAG: type II secretion system major pseudopilin GspG [bacterium]|nr:type II secretion system major pseudopilin GspG [bacterium]